MSLVVLASFLACAPREPTVAVASDIAVLRGAAWAHALLYEGELYGEFGSAVAGAGDLDGDGFDDVIVGAPGTDGFHGAAWLYRGAASGLDAVADATWAETFGVGTQETYGASVDGAGDVNGDGYDDLIVGAPSYGGASGQAFVYHGSAAGPSATPSAVLTVAGNYQFGTTVVGLGDANGDGYDDVAIGDEDYCACSSGGGGTLYPGLVHVYYGSAAGVPAAPSLTIAGTIGDGVGRQVAGIGDVDGDGYDDLAIGAPGASARAGEVWVYRGSAAGYAPTPDVVLVGDPAHELFGWEVGAAGDVNGDGYSDLIAIDNDGGASVFTGGPGGPVAAQVIATAVPGDVFGVGDLTGDGFDDVVVGEPFADGGAGRVCLYAGSATGVDTSACVAWLSGRRPWDALGEQVAGVGDTDGDGAVEVAIAAPHAGQQYQSVGGVVVVEGR